MKAICPSYSSSIMFSNEDPIHADHNYIISRSSESLSDLINYLHRQFRVSTPNDRMVNEEDFENIKSAITSTAQNGKQHFLFNCMCISRGERETRGVAMMRPMTTKQFPQEMLAYVQDFYATNPSVNLSDMSHKKFEKLIMLLNQELAVIFTAVNEETSEAWVAQNPQNCVLIKETR